MFKDISFSWELLRKTLHISGLFVLILYTVLYHLFSQQVAILAMTALLLIVLEVDYIRIEHKPKLIKIFEGIFREKEKDYLNAVVFFIISCIISFAAFDYWIAVLAMLMTVFGDAFAALFGRLFGETKIYREKSYVGTLAGLLANVLVGFFVIPALPLLFFAMAFVASMVEMFTGKLDDNLTVPLFAGFVGQMIVYFYDLNLPQVNFSNLGLF
ncbi:hypothetical protein HY604_04985 [Candidatus Peregrinibacteria bacterium]|nr:hypothetical protein [Candidatus Peregrinibacteria bacterium]